MVQSSNEISEKLQKMPKQMWQSLIELYIETILDEVEDRILNKEGAGSDDIMEIISKVKEQVNGEV